MSIARHDRAVNTSAAHVFDVLRFISRAREPLGVTEISRRLKLPASTVFRALSTLEEADYIQRYQNTPRFELAAMPHLLNRALINHFGLYRASRQQLRALAETTGETVTLWVRLGWFAVRIAGAFGSHDVYHGARLGETTLLQSGPPARTMLATLPTIEQANYRAFIEARFPDHRPVEGWEALTYELEAIATRGYAVRPLPMAPGFLAAALPLSNETGLAIAALMVDGPVLREGATALDKRVVETRDALQSLILAEPEKYRLPFAHMSADEIVLRPEHLSIAS